MKSLRLFICLFIVSLSAEAQDYFLKNFSEPSGVSDHSAIVALPDDGIVQVTQIFSSGKLLIRRINKCGDQIWAKELGHPRLTMDIVDSKIDKNGNFIFAGNLKQSGNNIRHPFLISIKYDGTVNYFKSFNLPANVESITYSFASNLNNEFFLYFNYNTGGTNPGSISVAKINASGNPEWFKSYSGIFSWGRCFATSDGGLLFRAGSSLVKTNTNGSVDWSNSYQQLGYVDYPVEVDGGYLLFKYPSGSTNNTTNLIKLGHAGEIKWVSNDFTNFRPRRGILRNNGNALFTGQSQGVGLVEVDTSSGSIVNFKKYDPLQTFSLVGTDLYEDDNNNILVSGVDNSGIVSKNLYLRVDSGLNLPSCQAIDLQISSTKTPTVIATPQSVSVSTRDKNLLSVSNESIIETPVSGGIFNPQCIYKENRGSFKLGNDTILCPGETLLLGNANSTFDDYTWSNGEKSKQIIIDSPDQYFLQVVAACDTLRDTINVLYYPDINLFIGNDTTMCSGDSIQISSNLTLTNYLWSTGETSSSIKVKSQGDYWLETESRCGKVRDSISISVFNKSNFLDLGEDTTICPEVSLTLGDPNSDFTSFKWQTGETSRFITVNQPGRYIVTATTFCDTLSDSIMVIQAPKVMPTFSVSRNTVQTGEKVILINTTSSGKTLTWELGNGELSTKDTAVISYDLPGTFTIRLTVLSSDGCSFSDSEVITVSPSEYIIPNVFSPNGDGVNDYFMPLGADISAYKITVYNRWGEKARELTNTPWEGRNSQSITMKKGVYFYIMTIYWKYGGSSEIKGEVSLLR